jgi:phosphoribosyl 1,2-cyclic phosphodiesterase
VRFASLGSGSRGNGSIVATETTIILVDCGFSYKEAVARLKRLGIEAESLTALIVTHEHSDHVSGVEVFANKHSLPVYASCGTWIEIGSESFHNPQQIQGQFSVGDIDIEPVTVPHDAREPLQFVFHSNGKRLGILSDLGSVSQRVVEGFKELDALSIEFNHDIDLLQQGPYPAFLKTRVSGDYGHLNNDQAASFVECVLSDRLKTVVACHVSETNNDVSRVEVALDRALKEKQVERLIASQATGFDWIEIGIS